MGRFLTMGLLSVATLAAASTGLYGWDDEFARARELLRRAAAAQEDGDGLRAMTAARQAESLVPGHPAIMAALARACALAGQPEEGLRWLEKIEALGVDPAPDDDQSLAAVRVLPDYIRLMESLARLRAPVGRAEIAARLVDRDLLAEGVAWDRASASVLVGSVHRRQVVRIAAGERPRVFAPAKGEVLDAVLGIAVETPRNVLWACTAALPEMRGYTMRDEGRTALVELDLATGHILRRLALPVVPGRRSSCNDVAVGPDGRVAVADAGGGALLILDPGAAALRPLTSPGRFGSPQGMAWSANGARLFVADYGRGLRAVDPASGTVTPIAAPAGATLVGIDGLVWADNGLIAIRNGLLPHAVLRIDLDAGGLGAQSVTVLAANLPEFAEPTLGTVVGEAFVFVANAQWARFAVDAPKSERERRVAPVLLRLRLRQPQ